MDDSRIIALFFERSEKAIAALSEKYGKLLLKIAENMLNNTSDAEECVNDAYLGCWNTIPPQDPSPLVSYVCRITRNLAAARYHANTAKKRNSAYDAALDELENCFPAAETVEAAFSANETARAIDAFLRTLPGETRVMFLRRYYYGDSVKDIAALFAVTEHTVSVRLFRVREKLRKHLIKEGVYL